jgi:hypothetical protein
LTVSDFASRRRELTDAFVDLVLAESYGAIAA